MDKGSTILCLISKYQSLMKDNPQSDRIKINMSQKKKNKVPLYRCASDFRESWDDVAWRPVQFSTSMYFCSELEVTHNPKLHEFNDYNFTQKDLIHLCTQIGGGGIYCKFPNVSELLFIFNEFVENKSTIQFWALWSKDI